MTASRWRAGAPGKVILLGEHGVLHGMPAVAASLPWGVEVELTPSAAPAVSSASVLDARQREQLLAAFGAAVRLAGFGGMHLHVESALPCSSGLGSSAAVAVAVARALVQAAGLAPATAAELAAQMERHFHGTPSGLDQATIELGGVICFAPRRRAPPRVRQLACRRVLPLVIALAGPRAPTRDILAARARGRAGAAQDNIYMAIGALARSGARALEEGELTLLGELMNENHALLARLGLSSALLDGLAGRLRALGAVGAKLTGAGGNGGTVLGLFDQACAADAAAHALRQTGVACLTVVIDGAAREGVCG